MSTANSNWFALILKCSRYDFEYEDDDEQENGDVDIENKYYNAKQMKVENPSEAVVEFLELPALEPEKGNWGFKGLKQAIKLEYKLEEYDKVSRISDHALAGCSQVPIGSRSLSRAAYLRQICRHQKLF